jgi:hypothetical protein
MVMLVCVWLATSAFNCRFAPYTPPPNVKTINVPYRAQLKDWYCIPASILMWHDYVFGSSATVTQDSIWDWANAVYPGSSLPFWPGGGMDWAVGGHAAANFIHQNIVTAAYGGFNGRRQMVADEQKGLELGNPTIVAINNESHAVIVKGASWHQLNDALGRPNDEWVYFQDPLSGTHTSETIGYWLNTSTRSTRNCGSYSECGKQIILASQVQLGQAALNEFEFWGGTYVGPLPSNPTGRYKRNGSGSCSWVTNDSGPNQCQPPSGSGRWKIDNGCKWFPNDSGPNQCAPSTGRWKINNGCVWVANDSGPNQCTPIARLGPEDNGNGRFALLGRIGSWLSREGARFIHDARATSAGRNWTHPMFPATATGTPPQYALQSEGASATSEDIQSAGNPSVPHPGSVKGSDVLENIAEMARSTHLDEFMSLYELTAPGAVRVRRVLDVRSKVPDHPDYLLVEIVDWSGQDVANVAITKQGIPLAVEDLREAIVSHPLDTDVAIERVNRYIGGALAGSYMYAPTLVERKGVAVLRPLVAVSTRDATVYFTSDGESFVESGSRLASDSSAETRLPSGLMDLRPVPVGW